MPINPSLPHPFRALSLWFHARAQLTPKNLVRMTCRESFGERLSKVLDRIALMRFAQRQCICHRTDVGCGRLHPWLFRWQHRHSRHQRPGLRDTSLVSPDPAVRRERAEASRRRFDTFMTARGVPCFETGASGLCFGRHGGALAEDDLVGHYARTFDIIVLGRPGDESRRPTIEAALFESGRPVLLVPPTPPAALGITVLIAWNRSTETGPARQPWRCRS